MEEAPLRRLLLGVALRDTAHGGHRPPGVPRPPGLGRHQGRHVDQLRRLHSRTLW